MRFEEAEKIGQLLAALPGDIGPVIELGSSTAMFRTVQQPHIDRFIHAPLRARGVKVVHTDLRDGDGIDVSGDIYASDVRQRLTSLDARTVLCCNIFEHVTDRSNFASICDEILQPGGVIILSVPYRYPYHLDPIDTMYRPAPTALVDLFPDYQVQVAEPVIGGSFWTDLDRRPLGVIQSLARALFLRGGWRESLSRLHRLTFLFRPYQVSVAVLRKP
ncbi:hypothetical protein [Brevundimonas sp.]|uniref:hypothetical protein n=1 Tax=Brevundimonas sp. TaxID=1871086 RepID=UPI003D139E7B